MTYASDFATDIYAQTAMKVGLKYKLKAPDMHRLAWALSAFARKRVEEGKPCHQDLLNQQAARLAKQ